MSDRTWMPLVTLIFVTLPALAADAPGDPKAGKAIFQANCAVCHGPTGKGDGPAAAGLKPRPANYSERTSDEARQLRIVTNGGPSEKLSAAMPAWDEVLTAKQIRDVVAYVRTELSGRRAAEPEPVANVPAAPAAPEAGTGTR